jgi:putative pyruvate formate lyase activating enzyme
MGFIASYIDLYKSGELEKRAEFALAALDACNSCPHKCNVNRNKGEYGRCASGRLPIVSSYSAHHGEEPPLSGSYGAGNIFLGNCNLKCIYCQNYEISQNWNVERHHQVPHQLLADIMIELQNKMCHNIGLVSPTHFSAAILKSIYLAARNGLYLPIIYNSNGYDSVEMLKLYEGVIDIYLPDFKYGNEEYAKKYSNAENYFEHTKAALKEMYRQLGDQLIYEGNVVVRGLIIRHLVLPNGLAESENVFRFIAEELSPKVYISLMSQYFPTNKANKEILLNRKLRPSEYEIAVKLLNKYGLENGWIQELGSNEYYRPHFRENRIEPFNK